MPTFSPRAPENEIPLRMLTHKEDILTVDISRAELHGISLAPKGYLIILEYLDELPYCTLEMFLVEQCWFSEGA